MVQECVGVSEEVFNVYIFLNHSRRYKKKQIERCSEKSRHQRQYFQNLDNFYMFFVNGKNVSLVASVKYTLSKLHSYYTQNCKFYYFLEIRICFVKKKCFMKYQLVLQVFYSVLC